MKALERGDLRDLMTNVYSAPPSLTACWCCVSAVLCACVVNELPDMNFPFSQPHLLTSLTCRVRKTPNHSVSAVEILYSEAVTWTVFHRFQGRGFYGDGYWVVMLTTVVGPALPFHSLPLHSLPKEKCDTPLVKYVFVGYQGFEENHQSRQHLTLSVLTSVD